LQTAAAIAQRMSFRLYAVGGIVRDSILAERKFELLNLAGLTSEEILDRQDLDLVVEYGERAGVLVAIALHQIYPLAKLNIHEKFQTAELIWTGDRSFTLDLATARLETYASPGENPKVKPCSLLQDLHRRDFRINAMAVELNPQLTSTPLIDLFQGYQDLQFKLIRAIEPGSFAEDPRRIFRAVRFAVRLGFAIAPDTEAEIQAVLATGLHDCIGGSRLRAELNYLLAPQFLRKKTAIIWRSLDQLGALRCIYHPFVLSPSFELEWERNQRWQKYFLENGNLNLEFLLSYLPKIALSELDLGLTPIQLKRLTEIEPLEVTLFKKLGSANKIIIPSELVSILEKYEQGTLLIYGSKTSDRTTRQVIWRYLQTWRRVKSPLTGQELKQLGCLQGKSMGKIMETLRNAALDGTIKNEESAKKFAESLIKQIL
jgi:tRNA nucleotidyltransferase (CCA-adding enzyme)